MPEIWSDKTDDFFDMLILNFRSILFVLESKFSTKRLVFFSGDWFLTIFPIGTVPDSYWSPIMFGSIVLFILFW
jgi:hypothetical protein